jgi:hypothetical protein
MAQTCRYSKAMKRDPGAGKYFGIDKVLIRLTKWLARRIRHIIESFCILRMRFALPRLNNTACLPIETPHIPVPASLHTFLLRKNSRTAAHCGKAM